MKIGDKIICKKYYHNSINDYRFEVGDKCEIICIYEVYKIDNNYDTIRYEVAKIGSKKCAAYNIRRFDEFFINETNERREKLKKLNTLVK